MSVFATLRFAAASLICVGALAACSNAPDREVSAGSIGKSVAGSVFSRGAAPAAPSAQQIATEAAQALASTDASLILLTVPERRAVTVMQRLEQNGGYDTYGTSDRRSLILRGGMLTGTRGLGNDLMSSDIVAVRALVAARRAGTAQRVMRHLDGEDLTLVQTATCTIRIGGQSRLRVAEINAAVTSVTETCTGDGLDFTNTYEVAGDGRILQSRQWHSPLLQHIQVQTLR